MILEPPFSASEGDTRAYFGIKLAILPSARHLSNVEQPQAFQRDSGKLLEGASRDRFRQRKEWFFRKLWQLFPCGLSTGAVLREPRGHED